MIPRKTLGPTVRTLSDRSRVRQGASTQGAIPRRTGLARPSAGQLTRMAWRSSSSAVSGRSDPWGSTPGRMVVRPRQGVGLSPRVWSFPFLYTAACDTVHLSSFMESDGHAGGARCRNRRRPPARCEPLRI